MRHPQASPCKIRSAGSPFQISAAVASQLHLYLSNVLKLQGLTKRRCSADDETDEESDSHKTVGSKSVSSHDPLQLTDGKPIS